MSLIRLHFNRFGHVELSFASARLLRRIVRTVTENGGANESTAYIQHDADVEALLKSVPAKVRRDFREGWPMQVRMDGWEAAHYYGWDAHRAFEASDHAP